MSTVADQLYQATLQLPESDRADLAAKLIDSIDPATDTDWTQAWDAEIAKRSDEVNQGKVKTIPWADVRGMMVGRRRYSFKQLMAGVTEDNIHSEVTTGPTMTRKAL